MRAHLSRRMACVLSSRASRSICAATDTTQRRTVSLTAPAAQTWTASLAPTHCSPEEMLQIMQVTGDHAALFAMAEDLGYVLIKNPLHGQDVEVECTKHLVATLREVAEFVEAVTTAAADHDITANERRDVQERCADAQGALLSLDAWVEQRHRDGKPAHLRAA